MCRKINTVLTMSSIIIRRHGVLDTAFFKIFFQIHYMLLVCMFLLRIKQINSSFASS